MRKYLKAISISKSSQIWTKFQRKFFGLEGKLKPQETKTKSKASFLNNLFENEKGGEITSRTTSMLNNLSEDESEPIVEEIVVKPVQKIPNEKQEIKQPHEFPSPQMENVRPQATHNAPVQRNEVTFKKVMQRDSNSEDYIDRALVQKASGNVPYRNNNYVNRTQIQSNLQNQSQKQNTLPQQHNSYKRNRMVFVREGMVFTASLRKVG
jgi:hypothetical protein